MRIPWTTSRSNAPILKEISLEYSLEGLMLKLKFQYFATWCKELTLEKSASEKTLRLGRIEGKRRREQQRMGWWDSVTNSMDMSLSKLWEILKNREAWSATVQKKFKIQSCPTLCDPMDCRPPSSSVHGISQARILEWVAISFNREDLPNPGIGLGSPALQADL